MGQLFGTDGIRGLANAYPMNGETVMAVGRAIAHVLNQHRRDQSGFANRPIRVVVGKDTRLSGYMLEMAMASGLCSMGAHVILIGPLPTPGVAFVTQSMRADAGIMISASHNAYHDNGIKVFFSDGFKLPDPIENEIERIVLNKEIDNIRPTANEVGKAKRIDDVLGRYIVYLKSVFPNEFDLSGLRIALDCANGAAYKAAPLVFEELGAEVIKKGVEPNGTNINENCGALHPDLIAVTTHEYRADLGVSLDGDGDRCILADETGQIVDGDQILGLCAIQMKKEGKLRNNTLVVTPMSNFGLDLSLSKHGIQVVRAPVGDRYVVERMKQDGLNLGGEQSGHLIFLDHSTTGDGMIGALKVLEVMKRTKKSLSTLKKDIELLPQAKDNVKVKKKVPLESIAEVKKAIEKAEKALFNRGRVFVRYSGTEPLARIMVEGEDSNEIHTLASEIASVIHRQLG